MLDFIHEYQTLITTLLGPFLAVLSSLLILFLSEFFRIRRQIERNRNEIDSIIFMATRDSEESLRDIKHIIPQVRSGISSMKSMEKIYVAHPIKLNKIFINEERLTYLKQDLDFVTQEQVNIAVSSMKKFNNYLDHFETGPLYIFDGMIKLLGSNILDKPGAFQEYKASMACFINDFLKLIPTHIEVAQRNILRPVAAQANRKRLAEMNKIHNRSVDVKLILDTSVILDAIKKDLS